LIARQDSAVSSGIRSANVSLKDGFALSRSARPINHLLFSEDTASACGIRDSATAKSAPKEWLAVGTRDLAAAT